MSDLNTLLAGLEFSRGRLLGLLETMEKTAKETGEDMGKVLGWRPGPGRAHLGWQAMHCAATHDRYVNVRLKGGAATDVGLVEKFAGGSTPSDSEVPTLADIRDKLAKQYESFEAFLKAADLNQKTEFPGGVVRTIAESAVLLTWHEAHHQGQMHLTWNLYKGAHGIK